MSELLTRAGLARDLRALGLEHGDSVLVHAAVSRVGPLLDGPDTVVAALRDAVGHRHGAGLHRLGDPLPRGGGGRRVGA